MTGNRIATLTAACVICLSELASCGNTQGQGKVSKYSSERSPYPFVGATKVVLEAFDSAEKEAKSALLQLDKNEVTFSSFGEPRVTTVFYKPIPVKLTPLNIADPSGQNRRVFAIELPKENAADLGRNSLRLLTLFGTKSKSAGVRLMLVNPDNKVMQVLELRAASN